MDQLRQFCDRLGSTDPAPGGGAAAGITLSLGAGCVEKAVRFSEGDFPVDLLDKIIEIKNNGFILTAKDQEAFIAWQNARKLPKSTDEEKKIRNEAVNKHSLESIKVPYEICGNCLSLLELIKIFQPYCNKWLLSDAAIGVSFAKASFDAGLFNIMINMPYLKDERFKIEINQFKSEKIMYFNNFYEQLLASLMVEFEF